MLMRNLTEKIYRVKLKEISSGAKGHIEYLFSPKVSDVVNRCEIRVTGLGRSGTHAIINWIGAQFKGKRILLIVNVKTNKNPFSCLGKRRSQMFNDFYIRKDFEERGRFRRKDLLMYHYEDALIEEVSSQSFEEKREKYLGKSAKQYDVLIMRDAFNFFASRLQLHYNQQEFYKQNGIALRLEELIPRLMNVYINNAKEFLGLTNILGPSKVAISYNDWHCSKEYRQETAKKLKSSFIGDKALGRVARLGGGSSFDF